MVTSFITSLVALFALGVCRTRGQVQQPTPPPDGWESVLRSYVQAVAEAVKDPECTKYLEYAQERSADDCSGDVSEGWKDLNLQANLDIGNNVNECKTKNPDLAGECDKVQKYVEECECSKFSCVVEAYDTEFERLGGREECKAAMYYGCADMHQTQHTYCQQYFGELNDDILAGVTHDPCVREHRCISSAKSVLFAGVAPLVANLVALLVAFL